MLETSVQRGGATLLTHLHLKHFKGWRDTGRVRLAPITALFGTNSSGKTSLLQSLLLMRQTTESPDRNRVLDLGGSSTLVDLGTYQDIQFRHNPRHALELEVAWREDEPYDVRDLLKQARKKSSRLISSNDFAVAASIDFRVSDASVSRVSYALGDAHFSLRRRTDGDGYDLSSDAFAFIRAQGRAWPLPKPTRFYGFPDQVRLYFQNASFLSDLELKFEQACSRIRYLGPLRDDPQRQYIFSGAAPGDVGKRGEQSIDVLVASNLAKEKRSRGWQGHTRRRRWPGISVERLVAEWLQELGLIETFKVETLDDRQTLYRVMVRRSSSSIPVLLTDVGFGVSQVLPVLVLLAAAREGQTIVLEQPEIHLHPAVQAGLADVIIETALARGVQIIFESHSEHLLARLQRRLAERTLARGLTLEQDDVALYFCYQDAGESRLEGLEVDLFGNIRNWPPEFFGNPLEESVAMVEAAARRSEQPPA